MQNFLKIIREIDILTWITIGILIYFAVDGYLKGFVKKLGVFVSLIITTILVWIVTPYITEYLMTNTNLYDFFRQNTVEYLSEANGVRDNSVYDNQLVTIDSYNIPNSLKESLRENNNQQVYNSMMVSIFEDYVSAFIAKELVRIIAFICSYIMIFSIFKITILSMEVLTKLPSIEGINQKLGFVFGLFQGLMLIWILLLALSVFAGKYFFEIVEKSLLLKFLYNNNLLLKFIIMMW